MEPMERAAVRRDHAARVAFVSLGRQEIGSTAAEFCWY